MIKYNPKQWMRWISSWLSELIKKTVILITFRKSFSVKQVVLILSPARTAFLANDIKFEKHIALKKVLVNN